MILKSYYLSNKRTEKLLDALASPEIEEFPEYRIFHEPCKHVHKNTYNIN